MSKSLKERLKRTIFSKGMLISILIGVLMLSWQTVMREISYYSKYGENIKLGIFIDEIYNAHTHSGYDFFAPIFAVLPAAIIFCDDYNSGYIKNILTRTNKKRYIKETFFCSSIAGGLAIFIPTTINVVVNYILGEKNFAQNQGYTSILDDTIFANIQYIGGGVLVAIMILILSFLFGAIWSNIGLLISAVKPNRYLALSVPFAIFFAIHIVCYKIGSILFLSPMNLIVPLENFIPSIIFPFVYQIAIFIIVYIAFYYFAKRRIKDV